MNGKLIVKDGNTSSIIVNEYKAAVSERCDSCHKTIRVGSWQTVYAITVWYGDDGSKDMFFQKYTHRKCPTVG